MAKGKRVVYKPSARYVIPGGPLTWANRLRVLTGSAMTVITDVALPFREHEHMPEVVNDLRIDKISSRIKRAFVGDK